MSDAPAPDPNPEQTALLVARVRRLMLIAGATTAIGMAAILTVIGYRLFKTEGSPPPSETVAMLPKGARLLSTAVAGDRLLVTVDVGGATVYDLEAPH